MGHERSSIAKITRPRISGILERNRLFKHLDHALKKPVVWISGPAGSGKTTLVSSYIKTYALPCLWYQVDSGDADVATFFYYLALAGKKAAPRKRKPLPLLTPEYLLGVPEFSRNFFAGLFSRLKVHSLLVFDNYQDVPDDASLHSVILDGLSMIPEGINIVIVSRSDPPSAFSRVRANQMVHIVGWQDLRLTREEFRDIIHQRGLKEQKEEVIQNLYSCLDGWAAGLQLFVEGAGRQKLDSYTIDACAHDDIFDYFAGEIFQRSNKLTQQFLLKTAFLPKITVPIAREITQSQQANEILADLTLRNYFTVRHAGVDPSYEYHPLFREFLLEQAEKRFTSEQRTELRRSAASLLAGENEVEAAVALAIQAQDWDLLRSLVQQNAQAMLQQGRYQTVQEWLLNLPKDLLDGDPWLLFWLAASSQPFDLSASRSYYARAYHLFKTRGDATGAYLAWAGAVDTFLYVWGDFRPLDYWIDELKKLRQLHPNYSSLEVETRVAYGMFCALMWRRPESPDIGYWADKAEAMLSADIDPTYRVMIGNYLLFYYVWWRGDLCKSKRMLTSVKPLVQAAGAAPLVQIMWRAMTGTYFAITSDFMACLKSTGEGLQIAQSTGVYLLNFMLLTKSVYGCLSSGNLEAIAEYLDKMQTSQNKHAYSEISYYHYISAWAALSREDLVQAQGHIETAWRTAHLSGASFGINMLNLTLAQIQAEQGNYKDTFNTLKEALKLARSMGSRNIEYHCLLLHAYISLKQGDEEAGLRVLRQAFLLGKGQGYISHPWIGWRTSIMTELYLKALEHNIDVGYIQDVIRKRQLVPEVPPVHLDNWPWAFRIYTLGTFELLKDDKPYSFPGRVQKKPLEMLKAIIALGGSGVSEEQITEALWPDAEGDVAHVSFKTTLHRLRQVIGNEKALQVKEGHVSLDDRLFWIDALAFQRIVEEAENRHTGETGTQRQGEEEKRKLLEKAIGLYRGHFLARDEEKPWAISLRERLQSKFLRAVNMLGDYWLKQGEVSRSSREKSALRNRQSAMTRAIECYQKGLEVDDLAEEFYQRLMACYQKLGRRAEAISVYNRCCDTLSATLGIEPSEDTELIYQQIKRQ